MQKQKQKPVNLEFYVKKQNISYIELLREVTTHSSSLKKLMFLSKESKLREMLETMSRKGTDQ